MTVTVDHNSFGFSPARLRFVITNVEDENFTVGLINSLVDIINYEDDKKENLTEEEQKVIEQISKTLNQVRLFKDEVHFKVCTIEEYKEVVSNNFPDNSYASRIINSIKSDAPQLYSNLCGRLHSLIRSDCGVHSVEDFYAIKAGLYIE